MTRLVQTTVERSSLTCMGSGVAGLPRPLLCYTRWCALALTQVRLIKTHSPPARGKDVFSWTGT